MLQELSIRNILLIDHIRLEFDAGLNVFTGETGAGKSILLDCLGLALNWRGRNLVVRDGAEEGVVEAVFDLSQNKAAQDILEDAGYGAPQELVLRRIAKPDGRKTAFINDRRANSDTLKRLSDVLIELHGQHDDKGVLDAKNHLKILDDFAKHDELLERVSASWAETRKLAKTLDQTRLKAEAAKDDQDFLEHSLAELEAFAPLEGEDKSLDEKRREMKAVLGLRDELKKSTAHMGEGGAETHLLEAYRQLDAMNAKLEGRFDPVLEALDISLEALGRASQEVLEFMEMAVFDPSELEAIEDRLFGLRALARKHGVAPDELPKLLEDFREQTHLAQNFDAHIASLEAEYKRLFDLYSRDAGKLTKSRQSAAKKLEMAVAAELDDLKLGQSRFQVALNAAEAGRSGVDEVVFQVQTNPGLPAGPIHKVGSGGELSRFILALKVVLAGQNQGLTMIFDEIDRGVGGATADAVGRRLHALSKDAQLLIITHSPQVAAFGGKHWQVSKASKQGKARTDLIELADEGRIDEIARMLSGKDITPQAQDAAKALLKGI